MGWRVDDHFLHGGESHLVLPLRLENGEKPLKKIGATGGCSLDCSRG